MMLRIFIVCPFGIVMSPGCCPDLHAPMLRPSITVSDCVMPPIGGSNVACASVRYAVSPVSVITDFDRIVEPPKLQTASPVNLLPTYFMSNLLHMPCIMPVDMRIISCCSDASRQMELRSGGRSLLRLAVVVISHSPGFSLGKSCACASGDSRTVSISSVRNMRRLRDD